MTLGHTLSPNDLVQKERIEEHGRLKVIGFVRFESIRYAVAICTTHSEVGLQLVRKDNAFNGQGAACCGPRRFSKMSDLTLARADIDELIFDNRKYGLQVLGKHKDRSKIRISVRGTILGASVRVEAIRKNLDMCLAGVKRKIEQICARHGDYIQLRVVPGSTGRHVYCGHCKVTGADLFGYSAIISAAPRMSDKTRAILESRLQNVENIILPARSKPHECVRALILELTGLSPHEEQTFAGLVGDSRLLRLDLFYPGLGRTGVVVEVQSIIHEKEIAKFGGIEKFKKIAEYDDKKRHFFLGGNSERPQLITVRGDQNIRHVREDLTKSLNSVGCIPT